MKGTRCTAIVLAAGQGKRMQTKVPKQYLEIYNKPVIFYTLQTFQQSDIIDNIILVVGQNEIGHAQDQIVEKYHFTKVSVIVEGGAERYDSVWQALKILPEEIEDKQHYVFIHDGVRMLIDEPILERAYEAVKEHQACVVAMPVKDTIKMADHDQFVKNTLNRRQLWQIQTPQVFEACLIKEAYCKLQEGRYTGITDDAMVVEKILGLPVKLVEGSYQNIKITTPEDLDLARLFLKDC